MPGPEFSVIFSSLPLKRIYAYQEQAGYLLICLSCMNAPLHLRGGRFLGFYGDMVSLLSCGKRAC